MDVSLGWDESGMSFESNIESYILEISNMNRIEYEYSVASNSIRILNGVEMSCRDAASSRGRRHKSVLFGICFFLVLSQLTIILLNSVVI